MKKTSAERLRKAAREVKLAEAKSLAKYIRITGRIPLDRLSGIETRMKALEELSK